MTLSIILCFVIVITFYLRLEIITFLSVLQQIFHFSKNINLTKHFLQNNVSIFLQYVFLKFRPPVKTEDITWPEHYCMKTNQYYLLR